MPGYPDTHERMDRRNARRRKNVQPRPQEERGDLPPLGELVSDDDGERVQCHVCGLGVELVTGASVGALLRHSARAGQRIALGTASVARRTAERVQTISPPPVVLRSDRPPVDGVAAYPDVLDEPSSESSNGHDVPLLVDQLAARALPLLATLEKVVTPMTAASRAARLVRRPGGAVPVREELDEQSAGAYGLVDFGDDDTQFITSVS